MELLLGPPPLLERQEYDVEEMKARAKWGSFERVDDLVDMLHSSSSSRGSVQLNHGSLLDLNLGDSGEKTPEAKASSHDVRRGYSTLGRVSKKKRKNPTSVHGDSDFGTQELRVGPRLFAPALTETRTMAHPLLVKTPRTKDAGKANSIPSSRSSSSLTDLGEITQCSSDIELNPKMKRAVDLFNSGKARKAIAQMIEQKLIPDSAFAVAQLLHTCDALNREIIGEYLSEGDDEYVTSVLQEFIAQLDFDNLDFDIALRRFLYCFWLPGEAQKIDRLVRQFAAQYYVTHPEDVPIIFKSELSVYVLSFGSIMLNSDAHNMNVLHKMTEKQFIENIQYTTGGEDIPSDFLRDLYFRINTEEIKMEQSEVRFPDAVRKGWLFIHTKGSLGSGWKQRWVVLSGNCLYLFKRPEDDQAVFGIKLQNVVLTPAGKEKGRQFCVRLHLPPACAINAKESLQEEPRRGQSFREKDGRTNHILLSATSGSEVSRWCKAIEANTLHPDG